MCFCAVIVIVVFVVVAAATRQKWLVLCDVLRVEAHVSELPNFRANSAEQAYLTPTWRGLK